MLRSHEYRALLRVSETRLLRHATYERNGRKLEMFAIRRGDQTIDCWAREDGSGQEEGQLCFFGADVPDGDVQIVAAIDRSFDRFRKAFDQETNAPRRKRTKRDDELDNALLGPPVSEQVAFDYFRFGGAGLSGALPTEGSLQRGAVKSRFQTRSDAICGCVATTTAHDSLVFRSSMGPSRRHAGGNPLQRKL